VSSLVVLAAGRARRYGGIKPLAPIGPGDEAVIDLLAGDALRAGFSSLVLVVNPDTGPLIQEHVARAWPSGIDVAFGVQERPIGTVGAVLAARDAVDPATPFGVANADDLYGADALSVLGRHLEGEGANCLVAFRLDRALVGELPVTRGVCEIADGALTGITERRKVARRDGAFHVDDGLEPDVLDDATLVSMNLWGFDPRVWDELQAAMDAAHGASEDDEVLLPELVDQLVVAGGPLSRFEVLSTTSRCLGVTHPDDLALVRDELVAEIARGERPRAPFPT
jgi:NDP-sugar pyrophosphorylase family protein